MELSSIPMRGAHGDAATHAPVLVSVSVPSRTRKPAVPLPIAG